MMSKKPPAPGSPLARYQEHQESVSRLLAAMQGLTSTEVERAINALLEPAQRAKWSELRRDEVASALVVGGLCTDALLVHLQQTTRSMLVADRQPRPLPGQEARVSHSQRRWYIAEQLMQRGVYLKQGPLFSDKPHRPLHPVDQPRSEPARATFRTDGSLKVARLNLPVSILPLVYTVRLVDGPGADAPWRFSICRPDGCIDRQITWPADLELHADDLIGEVMEKCSHPEAAARVELSEELQKLLAEPAEETHA